MTTINKLTQTAAPSLKTKISNFAEKLGLKSSHRKEDLPADIVEIGTKTAEDMSPTLKLYKVNTCLEKIQNQINEVQDVMKNASGQVKEKLQAKLENLQIFARKVSDEQQNITENMFKTAQEIPDTSNRFYKLTSCLNQIDLQMRNIEKVMDTAVGSIKEHLQKKLDNLRAFADKVIDARYKAMKEYEANNVK